MFSYNLRYVVRRWTRNPLASSVAALSLSLGVAATLSLVSLIDALLLKSLPGENPDQIVRLTDVKRGAQSRVSYAAWRELFASQSALDHLSAFATQLVDSSGPGEPKRDASALLVSGSFFRAVPASAVIGRVLSAQDDEATSAVVAVASHSFWSRELGSDPKVIGRTILISRQPVTIVGVTERQFSGLEAGQTFDLALTLSGYRALYPGSALFTFRGAYWLSVVGRLKTNTEDAEASLRALQPHVAAASLPSSAFKSTHLTSPWILDVAQRSESSVRAEYGRALMLLLGIAIGVLLLACVNAAHLLVAESAANERLRAIHLALGARPWQVARSAAFEAFALAAIATTVGAVGGMLGAHLLASTLATFQQGSYLDVSVSPVLAASVVAIGLLIGFVCTVVPAWKAVRSAPADFFRTDTLNGTRVMGLATLSLALVAAQVAVVFIVVAIGSSFIASLVRLTSEDYGFDRRSVKVASIDISRLPRTTEHRASLSQTVRDAIAGLPGIDSAALSMSSPFGAITFTTNITESKLPIFYGFVSSEYFRVIGSRLVAGEHFSVKSSPQSAVVTAAFAMKQFGSLDAIGKSFRLDGVGTDPFHVVGVTSDIKQDALANSPPAFVYLPWLASTAPPGTLVHVFFRSTTASESQARLVARSVEALAPGATVTIKSLDAQADSTIVRERAIAILSAIFGATALLLAIAGLYAMAANQVFHRRVEIGIRMALGASNRRVAESLLTDGVVASGLGLLTGLAFVLLVSKRIGSLLYQTTAADLSVLATTAALIAIVMFAAWFSPLRRAMRVDPARTLRCD